MGLRKRSTHGVTRAGRVAVSRGGGGGSYLGGVVLGSTIHEPRGVRVRMGYTCTPHTGRQAGRQAAG